MLNKAWRTQTWTDLDQAWDIIVIGGGITGAGIFNMAAQRGLNVLLLEARDFSFGTSSRSSKLVHGGIRYLRNKQFDVVRESVKERQRLIRESDGLVDPLAFIFPSYMDNADDTRKMKLAVIVYDLLAPRWQHRTLNKARVNAILPALDANELIGGVEYNDATVDDSQLVLRVILDGIRYGGHALNYAKVIDLLRSNQGHVQGVVVQDETGHMKPAQQELRARVVINATGAWTDSLRKMVQGAPRLRPLRGSHLIFSAEKLPINAAVTLLHPRDKRALFAIPWENRTMIGTTDLDHQKMDEETQITPAEIDYLLEATHAIFPQYPVSEEDIISTFSGLRPVINTNAPTPSKESRAHQIWEEDGLVTIAGGKLTIFRIMAADTLNFSRKWLPETPKFDHRAPCFIHPKPQSTKFHHPASWNMMAGRLGLDVEHFFTEANPDNLAPIDPLPHLWAELAWAANNEAVVHLDDLLLRRVRLGILMPDGGFKHMERIRNLVQEKLGWSDMTWFSEVERYHQIWKKYYYLP